MTSPKSIVSIMSLLLLLPGLYCPSLWASEGAAAAEGKEYQVTAAKGPQGGRLFTDSNIALELLIYEKAMPPHFRAFLYKNGLLITPQDARLTIQLIRFNGKKEEIGFNRMEDFLQSSQIIGEPHSFDVNIQLSLEGKSYQWRYATYEGRIKIMADMLKAADIQTATAGSHTIKTEMDVVGKIAPNRDTLIPIYARYAGIIKSLTKNLGDDVTKGEVLAVIESNESLQNYSITTPISGTVVQKYATNGELAQNTRPIYEIANLATVWADFTLYRKDAPLVKKGMAVIVTGDEGKPEATGTLSYIAPLGIEDSQTTLARAVLSNENRIWLPGMYVNGAVIIKEKTAAVAVPLSAIQRLNGSDVVFVQQGDYFEAAPVMTGEKDEHWVEIISGLEAGQRYVSKNSFFMKAELGKEGAAHEH
ncbi:efflux RND transporter periplasmic adaptor subunit [Legionella sp. CNM-4043-24]|uniref:efflux RND transporter periplasmic adaptor subunit n=1 Tax=Legionella sp. CNM-4043-24 TaxID=3421646 RepID=UPI00403B360A